MKQVYYHHPVKPDYSLQFVKGSQQAVLQHIDEREYDEIKLLYYPYDPPVFAVYVQEVESRNVEELQLNEQTFQQDAASLTPLGGIVAVRLFELLNAAVEGSDAESFRLYKNPELPKVDTALSRVDWDELLPTVAGELMSNLIISHSLPNANHRTAIAMLQFCIESIDASFRMPQTHIDDEHWQAWANEYIRESKRLITVRRNHLRFHDLARLDVDIVERKGEIEIPLSEYTLDISIREARRRYAEQHEIHCRQFATEIIAKADREDLVTERGPSRSQFREYLEIGVLEHDFETIFD